MLLLAAPRVSLTMRSVIVEWISKLKDSMVVADFGCGEAQIAARLAFSSPLIHVNLTTACQTEYTRLTWWLVMIEVRSVECGIVDMVVV